MANKKFTVNYPVVSIEWDDHFSTMGWVHPDELGKAAKAISIGFLIKETKTNYYVSTTAMANGTCCDPLTIMKSAVISFANLTRPVKAKPSSKKAE